MAKETIDGHQYGIGKISAEERDSRNDLIKNLFVEGEDKEFQRQLRTAGYFLPGDMKYKRTFYPFRRIDPYNRVQGTREYVFFTKPLLNNLICATKRFPQ
jgi:hypothetical protein